MELFLPLSRCLDWRARTRAFRACLTAPSGCAFAPSLGPGAVTGAAGDTGVHRGLWRSGKPLVTGRLGPGGGGSAVPGSQAAAGGRGRQRAAAPCRCAACAARGGRARRGGRRAGLGGQGAGRAPPGSCRQVLPLKPFSPAPSMEVPLLRRLSGNRPPHCNKAGGSGFGFFSFVCVQSQMYREEAAGVVS